MKLLETHHRIFVTSDTHFGHDRIIEFCNRPFADVDEMTEVMIQDWNDLVDPKDIVIHLGDFAYKIRSDRAIDIFESLNGQFVFTYGNHDSKRFIKHLDGSKKVIKADHIIRAATELRDGTTMDLFLCHYPMASWAGQGHGAIHLHGHMHGNTSHEFVSTVKNRQDVGMDAYGMYIPRLLKSVLQGIRERNESITYPPKPSNPKS